LNLSFITLQTIIMRKYLIERRNIILKLFKFLMILNGLFFYGPFLNKISLYLSQILVNVHSMVEIKWFELFVASSIIFIKRYKGFCTKHIFRNNLIFYLHTLRNLNLIIWDIWLTSHMLTVLLLLCLILIVLSILSLLSNLKSNKLSIRCIIMWLGLLFIHFQLKLPPAFI
jgi:hypothetical protein